ncbi:Os06g0163100 [Oryza sativa Japonica Group]|uniref:Os06g0163100 protein n=1 Tax=Oryza sativa subsp. japonica TaxID=39947 RepID=A0A0N7KLK9_ORYSJ|nr:hypothetical protein EE612_032116 [Oryza sativa]BAS96305.1 Os06g0163100 [Oryza sativa Japonica Group]
MPAARCADEATLPLRYQLLSSSHLSPLHPPRYSLYQQEAFLLKDARLQYQMNKHQTEVSTLQWKEILGPCTEGCPQDAWCGTGWCYWCWTGLGGEKYQSH